MSYNGSGTFVINSTGQPVSANTLIEAAVFNAFTADVATGLSTAITKDGQTTITADLPMSGYKFTGLGAGSTAGHSLRYEQLFTTSAVTLLGAMNWVKGADIASASTINLTTATGNAVHVTGTTQIDAVTLGSGMWRLVIFDGALTLTHHATNNNLPGGANITTAANDRALYWADGTTVYCAFYMPAAGYQGKDAELTAIAGLTSAANKVPMFSGSGTATLLDFKDEDNMASDSATAVPSQQSVKAYADSIKGTIVQVVEATPIVTVVTCNTVIPLDDTIPQNTEGDEVITVSITPTNASNRLRIEFSCWAGLSASDNYNVALFQDSTANALAAASNFSDSNREMFSISHEMAAGTTSSTTFKIRLGPSGVSTAYVNGSTGGSREFGGVSAARLRVTEIKV